MPVVQVHLDGDNCWPDLIDKIHTSAVIHTTADWELARLDAGMTSGAASVMLRINLPDGRTVLAETSLRALSVAVRALTAKGGG